MAYGKVQHVSRTQILTIAQSNVHDVDGNRYTAISKIKLSIQFDESGKIKEQNGQRKCTPLTGSGIAIEGQAYTIESVGDYIIRITVKNNQLLKLKM